MSSNSQRAEAGPSGTRRHLDVQSQSKASSSWSMMLFGGRSTSKPTDTPSRGKSSSSSGLGWGRRGASASARHRDEQEALITSATTGGDDFDDSDAISLLSNIADRDSRRGGSGAAARRRARARSRAQGRTCGTLLFDLEDWGRTMTCGLLGRNESNDRGAPRQRAASIGSVMSRGARRTNPSSSSSSAVATARHSRSMSDASTDSGGSLVGPGFAEDGDEDAGMLDDHDIARFGQKPPRTAARDAGNEAEEAPTQNDATTVAEAEANAKAQAEAEAEAKAQAERQKAREEEAARLQKETEAEARRQKEEEARLAAEEEAAIAKARRKAERKAARAGLLKLQQETQSAQKWRTEAEAEAAAGGFTFTDADDDTEAKQHYSEEGQEGESARHNLNYHDAGYEGNQRMLSGEYDQYGDADEAEAEGYYATVEEHGPGGVVHHHHYYHAPPTGAEIEPQYGYSSPHLSGNAESFADAPEEAEDHAAANTEKGVSEDEADIAGLSFGRSKSGSRRNDSGSVSGSRSGGGRTARSVPRTNGGSSSGHSGIGHHGPTSTSSSSAGGHRPNYRDRPRRHERTSSKSSTSSSGLFSYHSSNTIHPPPPPSTVATSVVASPTVLPNLYEAEPIYATPAPDSLQAAQFGKPVVDANEFGVITAGTDKGGAGRVKKSYREKRAPPPAQTQGNDEHETFEGFPGF